MYDANNKPARTRLSYYLRTGRLLPAESFVSQNQARWIMASMILCLLKVGIQEIFGNIIVGVAGKL